MLSYSGLSKGYYGEAILTSCSLLNRVPYKSNKVTLYELWKKIKPNINYIKVWGYTKIIKVPEPKRKKFREKGIESVFWTMLKIAKHIGLWLLNLMAHILLIQWLSREMQFFNKIDLNQFHIPRKFSFLVHRV